MDTKLHWEGVYQTKSPEQLSWFQAEATLSVELITRLAPDRDTPILDVGGGASSLVDGLLAAGYRSLSVLDIAPAALVQSQRRLGNGAGMVEWRAENVLTARFAPASVGVWHDRAVFHFLTDAADRARYIAQVRKGVRPQGLVLIATFADDGPTRCSGLDVQRYSPESLHAEFGADFLVVENHRENHVTPWGAVQAFTYCVCRYEPRGLPEIAA